MLIFQYITAVHCIREEAKSTKMIMGFAHEYIDRTMTTKHEWCTYGRSAYNHTLYLGLSSSKLHTRLQSVIQSTLVVSFSGNANKLLNEIGFEHCMDAL